MKRLSTALCLMVTCMTLVNAQTFDTPVSYMDYLSNREDEMSQKYLVYMSEVAHGNRARKMEKKRQEMIAEIRQSLNDVKRLKPYKGDVSLRDAYKEYWDILLKVFNEDYHKIVNMEEIAEQSYDNMEAYLMAQEKAGEVLDIAQDKIQPAIRAFAAKNNVKLIEKDSRMSKKLQQVGNVNAYYHQLYLIFFKSVKQEVYAIDAVSRKDINGVEQNRTSLIQVADEGLAKLDTMKPFKDDGSLINACRKALEFHKQEAENALLKQREFLLKNDEFEKLRKTMEAKPAAKRTQADVDSYNKAVNEINKAMNTSNQSLQSTNATRQKLMDNWDNSTKRFMELHVPHGK